MLKDFEKYLKEQRLSENSCSSYISDIKQYEKYYRDSYGEDLEKLTSADIQTYKSYLKNRLNRKPATINRFFTALRAYNDFLIEKNIQDEKVINDRDYIKIQAQYDREDIPEDRDINLLKHAASSDKRAYCVIILATYGGLRENEIVNLRISNIHLKENYIDVYGKGEKYRTVIINEIMKKALEEYLEERNKINISNSYLFVGKKSVFYGDKPLNRNFVNRLVQDYSKKAGVENIHPHSLRAYFCTNAYKVGYTLLQIASQAGHSSIDTTRRYIGKDTESLYSLSNKL